MNEEKYFCCIVPPSDQETKKRLESELQGCRRRVSRYIRYKAHILQRVLKSEEPVSVFALCREVQGQEGKSFSGMDFCFACGIVNELCGNSPGEPILEKACPSDTYGRK